MLTRTFFIPLALSTVISGTALAAGPVTGFDLVTTAEAVADRAAPEPPQMRSVPVPGAPRIELQAPQAGGVLPSPVDIRLRWAAEAGAEIDPASCRILYGRLGIDITSRVAAVSKFTAQGMDVAGAKLPSGSHRLTVEVSDNRQRKASRQFEVTVVDRP